MADGCPIIEAIGMPGEALFAKEWMMVFSKAKLATALVVMVAGSGVVAGEETFRPRSVAELRPVRLASARGRFEKTRDLYEKGRVSPSKLVVASVRLMEAEAENDDSRIGRIFAAREHFIRARDILGREQSYREYSRCVAPEDINETKTALLEAEFRLVKEREAPDDGKRPDPRTVGEVERRRRQARADRDAAIEASDEQCEADLRAGMPEDKAHEAHRARFKEGQSAFERDFGSDPRLYYCSLTLAELKERDEAKAIKR